MHNRHGIYGLLAGVALRILVALWALLAVLLMLRTGDTKELNDVVLEQLIEAQREGDTEKFNTIKFLNGVTDEDIKLYGLEKLWGTPTGRDSRD